MKRDSIAYRGTIRRTAVNVYVERKTVRKRGGNGYTLKTLSHCRGRQHVMFVDTSAEQ